MKQGGFGLVEAMAAVVIGLLLALAGSALLLGANASYLNTGANTRIDDGGRFALALIGAAVRQAGHDPQAGLAAVAASAPATAPATVPALPGIAGLDAASLKATSPGMQGALAASVNGSDVLSTHFRGNSDGATINCAGFDEIGEHGWSIFYVAEGGDGEAELRCKYKGEKNWASDAVVRGVDSFQVLYGLDTDTPADGVADQYVTANVVNALDTEDEAAKPGWPGLGKAEATAATAAAGAADATGGGGESHWRRVVAVRVALLLHGEFGSRPPGDPLRRYELLDGEFIDEATLPPPLQRRARRVFIATFAVRNR